MWQHASSILRAYRKRWCALRTLAGHDANPSITHEVQVSGTNLLVASLSAKYDVWLDDANEETQTP